MNQTPAFGRQSHVNSLVSGYPCLYSEFQTGLTYIVSSKLHSEFLSPKENIINLGGHTNDIFKQTFDKN